MTATIPTSLAAARLIATSLRPYYAAAVFALEPVALPDGDARPVTVDTAGRLWWSLPALAEPVDVIAARIVHGLEHLLRDHATRGRAWTPVIGDDAWTTACDCEIDDDLDDLELPADFATAARLGFPDGQVAEWYADRLRPDTNTGADQIGDDQTDDNAGADQTDKDQSDDDTGADQTWDDQTDDERSADDRSGTSPGEDGPSDPTGSGDADPSTLDPTAGDDSALDAPAPGPSANEPGPRHDCLAAAGTDLAPGAPRLSQARLDQLRAEVADAVTNHRGTVPAGIARWAGERTRSPRLDWRTVLLRHVRRATRHQVGGDHHDSRRPSRRSPHPILLPRLRGLQVHPAVVVDTSGSMSADNLDVAIAQIDQVLRTVTTGEPIAVIACDADVHAVTRTAHAGRVDLAGGGGSDMTPGIDAAIRHGADVVIVLTDGWVDWPDTRPRTPLIAGLIGDHCPADLVPDWIHTVEIDDPESTDR